MFWPKYPARKLWRSYPLKHLLVAIVVVLSVVVFQLSAPAQTLQRQLEAPEKVSVSIKNRDGRVTVNASDEQQKKVTIEATSAGLPVGPSDVHVDAKGESIQIEVRARREKDRIDIVVRIPSRSKVTVESEAGAVDIVGNVESATIRTNTGTIHW